MAKAQALARPTPPAAAPAVARAPAAPPAPAPTPAAMPTPGPAASSTDTGSEIAALLVRSNLISAEQLAYARRVRAKMPAGGTLLAVVRELGYATEIQVRDALRANRLSVGMGALLVELGHLRPSELEAALEIQKNATTRRKLGDILVEQRFVDEHRMIEVLSMQLGFEQVHPDYGSIDRDLLGRVNPRWCEQHLVVPLKSTGAQSLVAMADPLDRSTREAAESVFGPVIVIGIAGRREILEAIAAYERGGRRSAQEPQLGDSRIVELVNTLILDALAAGASDIHVEPLSNRLRVRLRCDGVLQPYKDFDSSLAAAIASRIKITANADISEKRRHQDGRIHFEDPNSGQILDIRVSVFGTLNGQKIVMRLLNRKATRIDIRETGLAPRVLERFLEEALDVPSGVILITGPTGSGKTTTLYGAVNYLNNDETSIATAEDPVEYVVDGIAQCSINPQLNITFDETLRHMVRQDQDIIVLGEIRDQTSAEAAIQAALTGHKVLTTFHTEDTIGGLLRLMNMNIETFLISSTVVSVLAQRLLRRVCTHCAEPYRPTPTDLRRLGCAAADLEGGNFLLGKGCTHCRYTGYTGRTGVFELLVLNEQVKDAILARRSSYDIRRVSMEFSGLITLLEDGLVKAASGHTSLAEVIRHLPRLDKPRPLGELKRLSGA